MGWKVERWVGSAAEFHARELPEAPEPVVWVFEVARPALVLGSTQPDTVVDHDACRRAGVEVVRRRSGGGAVLLDPGEAVWIDVVIPTGHPRWQADVGAASWWLGEVWAEALGVLGVASASVHRGPMVRTPWSALVCFAGLGPGEVLVDGVKSVGISQRRTRRAARFQTAAALQWRPARLVSLLSPPFPTDGDPVENLVGAVAPVSHPAEQVVDAVLGALARVA